MKLPRSPRPPSVAPRAPRRLLPRALNICAVALATPVLCAHLLAQNSTSTSATEAPGSPASLSTQQPARSTEAAQGATVTRPLDASSSQASPAKAASPAGTLPQQQPLPGAPAPRIVREARDEYLAGARLLEHSELAEAQSHFERAAHLDPTIVDYQIAARIALEHRVTALVEEAGKNTLLGQGAQANALLTEARRLDPENSIVTQHAALATVGPRFASVAQATPASGPPPSVIPGAAANDEPWRLAPPALAGPIHLQPDSAHKDLHLRGDLQTVVREAFTRFGIRPAFDESVAAASPPQGVRFDLDDTTFAQAAPIVLSMGRLFFAPLDAHSVVVATDTTANRARYEHLYQETIYTPGLTPQQLGEVTNVIRQIFDVRQLSMQNTADNITLRAPAGTLDALNQTLEDLLSGSAEITFDLRLFSVDTTRTRSIGPNLPQQFAVYNVASAAQALVSANQSAVNQAIAQGLLTLGTDSVTNLLLEAGFLVQSGLATSSLLSDTVGFFGKGLLLTGVTQSGGAGLTLALNSSDTRALDAVQLRAGDHQTATFRAGTRYPITVGVYSSGLSSAQSSALSGATINGVSVSSLLNQYLGANSASASIPQIQYEDLGLTLEATPHVQSSGNISLHLDLKIEALTGSSEDNIPILASRRFGSDVTVSDGQTALLLSSLSRTESIAVSGIPGLGELPGFQGVTSARTGERDTTELVLLLTPHMVRHRTNPAAGPRIAVSAQPDSD